MRHSWETVAALMAAIVGACVAAMALAGCDPIKPQASPEQVRRVTLYTSTDAPLLPPILDRFMAESGVRVDAVTDTEATKTTGLVERLLSERSSPRADVWWSNEASGTVALARAGVLVAFDEEPSWPAEWRGPGGLWHGFSLRARVIATNTKRVAPAEAPTALADLLAPRFKGRIGMARPQFGTTRSQVAALVAMHGEQATRAFLAALKSQGVRLYNGNSAVVRALANAEIDAGLTDTDDVIAGQREGWPVACRFERVDGPDGPEGAVAAPGLRSLGPLAIPNTVALVRGGPHPEAAAMLVRFLLSASTEEMLARGESRNVPVRATLAASLPASLGVSAIPSPARVTPEQVADAMGDADRIIAEVFPLD